MTGLKGKIGENLRPHGPVTEQRPVDCLDFIDLSASVPF